MNCHVNIIQMLIDAGVDLIVVDTAHGHSIKVIEAVARYLRDEEPDVQVMSLVDYDNNAVETSLAVARAMRAEFGDGVLTGVRVDTSERLIDESKVRGITMLMTVSK